MHTHVRVSGVYGMSMFKSFALRNFLNEPFVRENVLAIIFIFAFFIQFWKLLF